MDDKGADMIKRQSSFFLDLDRFAKKVAQRGKVASEKICVDIDTSVVLLTPVDTGRARAGWQVGRNMVNMEDRGGIKPGKGEKAGSGGSLASMILRENEREIAKLQLGDVIYISNNVEYITYLEDGTSGQNRQGMVAKTLRMFPQIISEAVRSAKIVKP